MFKILNTNKLCAIHKSYTLQVFRVVACATKLIADNDENEEDITCNEKYQNYKKMI